MTQVAIDHRFPSALAKRLRRRLQDRGVDLKHTEILDDIASALGWRTDALMHALKSASENPSSANNEADAPEVDVLMSMLLRTCPEDTARTVVRQLLDDGWELTTGDGLQCWRKPLARPEPEIEIDAVIDYDHRLAAGDPESALWSLTEETWRSGDSTARTWDNITLTEALETAASLAARPPSEQEQPQPTTPDIRGRYHSRIVDHEGGYHAGMIYGTPTLRDGLPLLEESFFIEDLAPGDTPRPPRGRWLLIIGNEQYQSDDLADLEPILFEFIRTEWGD